MFNEYEKSIIESQEFKNWFYGSKIIYKNGEPKLANHYSNNPDIERFKMSGDVGYERKHSLTNTGIYFNVGETLAKYGKYGYYVFLNFKNPLYIKEYHSNLKNPETKKDIHIEHIRESDIKFLTDLGYDSAVSLNGQVVAFNSDQIRILYKIIDGEKKYVYNYERMKKYEDILNTLKDREGLEWHDKSVVQFTTKSFGLSELISMSIESIKKNIEAKGEPATDEKIKKELADFIEYLM